MPLNCGAGEDSWKSLGQQGQRSNQSIIREIISEFILEGLRLKLKLQYFGHLMQTDNSLEKTLMLRKIEGRRREHQRMRWLDGITDAMDINFRRWWGRRRPGMLQSMGSQSRTRLGDWTITTRLLVIAVSPICNTGFCICHRREKRVNNCDWEVFKAR